MTTETTATTAPSIVTKTGRAIVATGGAMTVLVALATDVLPRLGNATVYLAVTLTLLLLMVLIAPTKMPGLQLAGQQWLGDYWGAPCSCALVVSIALLVIAHSVTSSAPTGGWLASQVQA